MSKFVATKVGVFRHWRSSDGKQGFLFLCPVCDEWLPMDDRVMGGEIPVTHEFRNEARFCAFEGLHPELGPALVSTAQACLLIDGRAWVDNEREAMEQWKSLATLG